MTYRIAISFEAKGIVEELDVYGAVYSRTAGFLPRRRTLDDLRTEGEIGRIKVDLESESGVTCGTLKIPAALKLEEAAHLAACFETIERIGPCDADFKVKSIRRGDIGSGDLQDV